MFYQLFLGCVVQKKRLQAEGSRLLEERQEQMRLKQKLASQGLNANATSHGFQLVVSYAE